MWRSPRVREVGVERESTLPEGVELDTVAARPELLRLAYDPVARDGYADMPLPFPVHVSLEEWLEEEATLPEGSFVALADGEVIGYAGLLELAAKPGAGGTRSDRCSSPVARPRARLSPQARAARLGRSQRHP